MKAVVIGQKIALSMMDYVHGGGQYTKRLVVQEKHNLTITIIEGHIAAFTGFDFNTALFDVLGEVEISEELVQKAMALAEASGQMYKSLEKFEDLINSV